jgi:hypothetical protein
MQTGSPTSKWSARSIHLATTHRQIRHTPRDPQGYLPRQKSARGRVLQRGDPPDLMHDFASLFGNARCRGRPLASGAEIPDFRGHPGTDLCTIVQANFGEFPFHALR